MKEQIYNDFTTKLLPQIQEGLSITKDYFFDLFGRYIKYLIVSDTIFAVLSLIFLIVGFIMISKGIKWGKEEEWCEGGWIPLIIAGLFMSVISGIVFLVYLNLIIKDIYIPEIRVMEELSYQLKK